jgi:hypothetical protein
VIYCTVAGTGEYHSMKNDVWKFITIYSFLLL